MQRLKTVLVVFLAGMLVLYAWLTPRLSRTALDGHADFSTLYTAGKIVRQGLGQRLYDATLQQSTQQEFVLGTANAQRLLPYMHPPFEAALFAPLAALPFQSAYILWLVINFGLLALIAMILRTQLRALWRWSPTIFLLAVFAFPPVAHALIQGQDSILLLFFFLLACVCWQRSALFSAGCFLALCLIKFHVVAPFVLVLFLTRRWRTLAGFATMATMLLLISLTVAGWQGLTTYPHFLWDLNRAREAAAIYPRNMPNLRGLIEGWSAASASMHSLEVIVLLLSVALVAWAARTCRFSAGANTSASSFALVLIVSFLVGYHSSGFDAAFLLLPALLAAERVLGSVGGITTPERITLICIGTLYFAPLYLWLLMPLAHLNLLALVLLLWAWATAAEVRQAPGALVT